MNDRAASNPADHAGVRVPPPQIYVVLFGLALFAQLLSTVAAFTSGQAASLVLGQPNFTSNAFVTTASGMYFPTGVAVGSTGRLWVADTNNHRVLRFDDLIPRTYLPQITR